MKTNHKVIFENAIHMEMVSTESIDLMVTSPPYPMIAMWDEMFTQQSSSVKKALEKRDGPNAFELMHHPSYQGTFSSSGATGNKNERELFLHQPFYKSVLRQHINRRDVEFRLVIRHLAGHDILAISKLPLFRRFLFSVLTGDFVEYKTGSCGQGY